MANNWICYRLNGTPIVHNWLALGGGPYHCTHCGMRMSEHPMPAPVHVLWASAMSEDHARLRRENARLKRRLARVLLATSGGHNHHAKWMRLREYGCAWSRKHARGGR